MRAVIKDKKRNTRNWLYIALPLLPILAYIVIASIKIRYPGVQYDEALYVNAALGGVDKVTFLIKSVHGVPVLLMPYIGALKSYIFYPIFALFKVSAVTMRLPDIFITAAALYLLYYFIRKQLGAFMSAVVLVITATDASFIIFTRLDNGPVVLDFLLKIIGLIFLFRFINKRSLLSLISFWVTMLIGEFNKLNFIWYVCASLGGMLLIYGVDTWRTLKPIQRLQAMSISAIGILLCIGYYLYLNSTYHISNGFAFTGWSKIYSILAPLISGTWFYNYALSKQQIGSNAFFWIILITCLLGALGYIWLAFKKQINDSTLRFYGFVLIWSIILFIQISITKQATAGWHYFSFYPTFTLLFILSIYILSKLIWRERRHNGRYLVLAAGALFSVYQLAVYNEYLSAYNKPTSNVIWSPAIYGLINYAKAQPNSQFISLDWGTQTQLIGFNPMPDKYYEVFGPINIDNSVQSKFIFNRFVTSNKNAYYVDYVKPNPTAPVNDVQFFDVAKLYGEEPYLVKTVLYDHQPIFYIYRLK